MCRLLACIALVLGNPAVLHADCPVQSRVRHEARTFLGYACEDDCAGHKAGLAWAVRRSVSDGSACSGLGPATAEGCRAFVEEHLTPEQAGYRWALENEIVDPCLCDGGGAGFRAGCLRQIDGVAAN